jgi:hypothetical protein
MNTHGREVKAALLKKAQEILQNQVKNIEYQLKQLFQAGAEEGKSSAGDKYETQREMIKQSCDQLDIQLARTQKMLEQLKHIPIQAQSSVQEGALFKLPNGWILVSVSLGKLEMEGQEYQLISKDSPLFLALQNKKIGESVLFRGKDLVVEGLV